MQTSYYLHPRTDTDLLSLALKDSTAFACIPLSCLYLCVYVALNLQW